MTSTLTPMGCLECGKPPDCQCSYCPAVLCFDCLEIHEEEKHGEAGKVENNVKKKLRFTQTGSK